MYRPLVATRGGFLTSAERFFLVGEGGPQQGDTRPLTTCRFSRLERMTGEPLAVRPRVLRFYPAAYRLVDLVGPNGWQVSRWR